MDEGAGIIYQVELKTLENPFGTYEPLGPQLLPRPADQCAWVAELPMFHSFEDWPDVKILQFNQRRFVGEYFLRKFDSGKGLFPPDPLADIAQEILACGEVPAMFIERAIESFAKDPLGIDSKQIPDVRRALSKVVALTEYRGLLTQDRVASLLADFEWRKKMLSDVKVHWRLVRSDPTSDSAAKNR